MTPTLIAIVLLVIAVGVVVWLTRRNSAQPRAEPLDQDVNWNDPVTPAARRPEDRPKP